MYCSNCGEQRVNNFAYCQKCGSKFEEVKTTNNSSSDSKTVSIIFGIIGIAGSILIVFIPIAFVLSLIGLILAIISNKKEKNTTGIVLNIIGLFLSIAITCLFIWIISIGANWISDIYNKNEFEYQDYLEKF